MQLTELQIEQAENMALLIDNLYKREQPSDRLKVAFVKISELDETTKALFNKVCNILSIKNGNDRFKGCICHKSYIGKGGIMALFDDLKAVCQKNGFNYDWALEFIHKHARPNNKNKTWVMNSGAEIENPIAIFTNWCKKYKRNEGAYYVP